MARTLERRWDESLRAVQQLEAEFDRFTRAQPRLLGEAERERIRRLAGEVPTLWHAPTTTHADRRQVVRLLIDRVVLTVAPGDDRVTVRVEWAGGAVRERTIRRDVQGYKHQQDWPRSVGPAGGAARPRGGAEGDRDGPRPGRVPAAEAGVPVHGRDGAAVAARARVAAARAATCGVCRGPVPGEWWLHDLARDLGLSPHTLHGWRKKGWMHARQVGGRGGPWAVWADATELDRLRALKDCPRLWTHRERLAELRVPGPRHG